MQTVSELLNRTKVELGPETYTLLSLRHEDWLRLLENPELSPRMTAPFMILRDNFEVTMMLDEKDFGVIRHAVPEARTEGGFRLLTFDIELGFGVTGFLAEVSRIFAETEIPIFAVSAFTRDHLLIKQADLAKALKVLGPHIAGMC